MEDRVSFLNNIIKDKDSDDVADKKGQGNIISLVQPLHSVSDGNFMDKMVQRAEDERKNDELKDDA